MALPVVFHELYSAPSLRPGHRFPMKVFQEVYDLLLSQNMISTSQVHRPLASVDPEILKLAHCNEYVENFLNGTLDSQRCVDPCLTEALQAAFCMVYLSSYL